MTDPTVLDDLEARGLVQECTDRDALARPSRPGADHAVLRLRPDGRQPPRRQPHRAARAAPLPGGRAPADRPGRRRHGDGGRPRRPVRGTQPPRRGHAARQRGVDQGPDLAHPRPGGTLVPGRQLRLDPRPAPARLPARRRQARHRQPDARPRVREGPHRLRARHLLHRVQLHAPSGQRLPVAARPRGLRAADRRLGPVGQHPLGRRPDPPEPRCGGARPGVAAAHRTGRHEARQDDGRPDLAGPGPDQPVPAVPALDADRRPPGRPDAGPVHAAAHGRRERRSRDPRAGPGAALGRNGCSHGRSRRSSTGPSRRQERRRRRPSSSVHPSPRRPPRRSSRWPGR